MPPRVLDAAEKAQVLGAFGDLDAKVRPHLERLVDAPLAAPATLRAEVDDHLVTISEHARSWEYADLETAERLAGACRRLIDGLGPSSTAREHMLVQVAARYFVLAEDADGDLTSICGFDDDVEVLNAAAAALERDDLTIRL